MNTLLRNNFVELLETWNKEIIKYKNAYVTSGVEDGRYQQIIDSIKILKNGIRSNILEELKEEFLKEEEFII
jgi:hypothetical protein